MLNLLYLAIGLGLLIFGAGLLVKGVSALARAAGVPPLVIGLTLVAFGTSLPEVVINTVSARHGQTGLAFGNVVGSSAINLGFVLAVTAIVRPLRVEASVILREIPMMLLAVSALIVLCGDKTLNHAQDNALVRGDGVILLLLFAVFVYYVVKDALTRRDVRELRHDPLAEEVATNIETGHGLGSTAGQKESIPRSLGLVVLGLIGVVAGGRLAVYAAVNIAAALGVPEVIIGLTIVSFGTTLPELVTSITAARRGQADIAIGNVVGSNIFNMLFISGLVSTIQPVPIPPGGGADLLFLAALCAVTLPVALRSGRRITRGEGVFLLLFYLSYTVWRTAGALHAN